MTHEEHKKITSELMSLATAESQARVSELLTSLSDDYAETLTKYETANNSLSDLQTKNETLREVNAKLFLKVGETDKETKKPIVEEAGTKDPEPAPTFDALFNEKGELI